MAKRWRYDEHADARTKNELPQRMGSALSAACPIERLDRSSLHPPDNVIDIIFDLCIALISPEIFTSFFCNSG
jgi:hypothetical protein